MNTIRETGRINGKFAYNSYRSENEQGESEYIPYLADVYNFEVEDYHTYYVGTRSFWVHNTNCGASTSPMNAGSSTGNDGLDVLKQMEKTAKNVYSSSDQMIKDLPDDLRGAAIVKDIELKSNPNSPHKPSSSQGQQMGYGSLSQIDPVTGKEMLYALTFGYPNPFVNGKNAINRGDVIIYADIDGSRVPTTMSGDIKWDSTYGYKTGPVYAYLNDSVSKWKSELNELSTKDPELLTEADFEKIEKLKDDILNYEKNTSTLMNDLLRTNSSIDYYGGNYQHTIIPTVASGELSTSRSWDLANALAKMATDPAIKNTIEQMNFNQSNLAKYGDSWSPNDWLSDDLYIAISKGVEVDGEIKFLPQSFLGFEKIYKDGKLIEVKIVEKSREEILKPLDLNKPYDVAIQSVIDTVKANNIVQHQLVVTLPVVSEVITSITSVQLEELYNVAEQYWLNAGAKQSDLDQISIQLGTLKDNIVAITEDTHITVSLNAAGWGWFVDATPNLNEEFNLGSTNYNFDAKSGSEADNKIDLLTVLIHEIGNVLGVSHRTADDVMSLNINEGQRRLPNANDAKYLAWLSGQAYDETSYQAPGYAWQAPVQINDQFQNVNSGTQIGNWFNQGEIILNGQDVQLNESANQQTNLSQAFKVGEYDRVLTFTVKDQQLSDYNNRPDDAFEVALLDARTGEALFKVNDLNNTDSLFNLQTNGTYSLAQGIERIINADGTQTFFINLDQALVGREVLLSFDLLGFGEADSHVTLSNIRIVSESMAINDQYKLNEDTLLSGNVLNNDVLIHQTVDNVILVNAPQHGELILKANGEFSYTPHANYFGEDQFSYYFVMTDGTESKVATVKLDIQSVNDAPEFVQQPEWEIIAGQPLVLDFDQYVQDIENDDIQISITLQPEFGAISFDAQTGQYIYLVDKDFVGTDSFSIVLSDGEATSETYTFSIKVLASNTAPELVGQNIVTDEDRSIVIDLLVTAHDEDADTLTAVVVTQPAHGRLELLADGRYQYVPADHYHGTDSFSHSVSDGELSSQVVSVNIVIHAVNDAPELSTQQLVTDEDTSVIFNPFATASDIDSVNLTAVIVAQPQNGRLTQISTGAYLYVPYENYNGTDSFSYLVSDGELNSQIVTVSIVIRAVNDAPVASPMIKTLEEDTEIVFSLLSNAKDVEGDHLTAVVVNPPLHGQLTETLPGIYHYVPEPNFNGEVIFSYYVTDGVLKSETVNVLLVVTPVNDKPTLTPRIISMVEDGQLMLNLLENAYDVEGDQLSIVTTEAPLHGQFTATGGGYYHFIPEPNFNGEVKFSYYVTDGQLNSETVNILIIVNAVNDAPVLSAQNLVTDEDTALIFNPLQTASDVDGDSLTSVIANAPTHGQLVQLADGRYQYQPVANYYGTDSFSYFVTDGQAQSQIVNVNITINPVNDMPIAKSNAVKGQEDQALILKWSDFSLSDVDGDTLKLLISSLPERGLLQQFKDNQWIGVSSLTLLGQADFDAGHIRFVPAANEASDAFIAGIGNIKQIYAQIGYKAFDGQFYSESAYLNIEVEAVVDQPVVSVGSSTTQEIIFQTGWETAVNQDSTSTLLEQNVFEGWTLLKGLDCNLFGTDGFEIWSNNDRMDNAFAIAKTVQAKAGNGQNWLELNDAGLFQAQTLGISRNVETELGRSYNLSFDYAGRLGFSECFTQIAIYVDGKRIATYANTSPNDQLNWKNVQFSFVGTGKAQNIQIRIDAPLTHLSGRGAMIDNIVLSTQKSLNTGKEDQSMLLPELRATLQDTDGSEQLKLALVGLPVGSQLTDGTHQFIVTEQKTVADITGWNVQTLQLTPPKDFSGEINVQVVASSIERSNGDIATAIHELKLQIDALADAPVLETQQSQNALTSFQMFQTEWSGVYNAILNKNATVLYMSNLDGWTGRSDQSLKLNAFEVWHAGDQIKNTSGKVVSLQDKTSNAWIRLNDGKDTLYQQNAIERSISTMDGNVYNLSLDMAGLPGLIADYGRVGIYLDGQRIASFDAASDLMALNWQQYNIDFNGNGKERVLRIQLEGNLAGRSAFISNIRLVETYISTANTVYAAIGQTTYLPVLAARSSDLDGSETIKLEISGLSQGTVLTDGTRYITVQSVQQWIDISQWDTTQLRFASNSSQNMSVQVRATAVEQSNQHSASKLTSIQVNMLGGTACATPWQLLNGFVSAWSNHVSSVSLAVQAQWACPIQFNSTLDFNILKSSQDEDDEWLILREQKQSDAWLKALELQAQLNWKKLI
ncbi:tandem-95 repeat protein [Acinetobacter sp. BSP-28]|uniref:tandem-95 repeat protein n=1 Tax=Acinetobacter sp. BSP-28 TaxID=3344661 RepID=UPI00376FCAD4